MDSLIELFQYAHERVKTAWYCGLDMVPKDKLDIIQYLDYLKVGHYDQDLGALDSFTTNQRFYKIKHLGDDICCEEDSTYLFNNKNKINED